MKSRKRSAKWLMEGTMDERRTVRYRRPRRFRPIEGLSDTTIILFGPPIVSCHWLLRCFPFKPRWWGKTGARSSWIGGRSRDVRAHSQNYRPRRQIERRARRDRPRASLPNATSRLSNTVPVYFTRPTLAHACFVREGCRWTVSSVATRISDR